MDKARAAYCVRLLMKCAMYLEFSPKQRLAIFKRVMAQVVSVH